MTQEICFYASIVPQEIFVLLWERGKGAEGKGAKVGPMERHFVKMHLASKKAAGA